MTKMTESTFKNVKLLQEAGLKASKASKILGVHSNSVYRIYSVDNLDGYNEATKKYNLSRKVPTVAPEATPEDEKALSAYRVLSNIYERIDTIMEKQDLILGKIKWIEENVEVKNKRKFF